MQNRLSLISFLMIPILFLWNPSFLSLMGFQPYWPIFWILPWAIIYGPINGIIIGLFLGIILDSIANDIFTQIPGLIICGFWFGKLSAIRKDHFTAFQYGLVASLGSLICGFVYFLQLIYQSFQYQNNYWLISYGIQNITAQVFLTGLFAPVFCSWLFVLFNRKK